MTSTVRVGQASLEGAHGPSQDFAAVGDPPVAGPRGIALALADGAGTGRGGREAAEIAVRQFLSAWYAAPETWGPRRVLESLLPEINEQVRREAPAGAVCTFTAVVVSGARAHVAHVGDSRAWLVRQGRWTQVTKDHCWSGPDIGDALYRAMGLDETLQPQISPLDLEEGDWLVLATDGVHKSLDPARFLLAAPGEDDADPQRFVEALVREARRKGQDDTTALALRIGSLPAADTFEPRDDALHDLPCFAGMRPGVVLDGFELGARLARGNQSEVWTAVDLSTTAEVVLKFPNAHLARDPRFRDGFLREEWLGARIDHPGIVGALPVQPGRRTHLYHVLRRVPGRTLREILRTDGALDSWNATRMALDLSRALVELHRVGVLHRDVKPENILIQPDGRAMLLDLGVAHVESLGEGAGNQPGTPSYMAPELFEGGPATEATEVYSLGATLYEALTTRLPYGEVEVFSRPVFADPVPPSRLRPTIAPWLETVVLQAVAKDPATRFEVVSELAHHLDLRMPAAARSVPPGAFGSARERFWKGFALAMAVIATLELLLLLR